MSRKSEEIFQKLSQQLRENAEAQLENVDQVNTSDSLESNLLRELRVHQIELEMQNEELQRAQYELEISRDSYLNLYKFAPVGYLTINQNGIITQANLMAAKLFGVDRVKLINRRFTHYITPEEKFRWHHFFLAGRQVPNQSIEVTLCRPDGSTLYALINCQFIDQNQDCSGLCITIIDITERKLMQDALQQQKIRLALALESAELATWDWDIQTGQYISSRQWADMCGFKPEEIGTHISFWQQIIVPDDTSRVLRSLTEHLNDDTPLFNSEYRIRNKQGQEVWILDRGKVVQRNWEGKALRMTGIAMNITQRKQIEQQLRVAAVSFETLSGILITDDKKNILSINKAFIRIFGYSLDEIKGLDARLIRSGLHDESFYQQIWDSIDRDSYWEGETWNKRKNGEIFPVWTTAASVKDAYGKVTHYVGSFTDISVQKQAEKVLIQTQQKLQNQVVTSKEELEILRQEQINTSAALNVLLKYRETDKSNAQYAFSYQVDTTLMPLLKTLKKAVQTDKHQTQLLQVVEANLQQLVTHYGRDNRLSSNYLKLTPSEVQVASMIRQGMSTKAIATTLKLSTGTIGIHRKHIRKKLGLSGSDDNLYNYLLSLSE